MTKAFAYIRCSGLSQMDGDGPVRQRSAIERYALANDIEIIQWFEESHTGSDLEGRIAFRDMRSAVVSNGVRTVVIEKMDRLARDMMIQESVILDFQKNGITLRSATPGEDDLCGSDPTRVMIRQIMGAFYEYERKMIASKLRAGQNRKKAILGRSEGRKPYGYMSGGPKHGDIPNPSEYPTLLIMRDLRTSGDSAELIADKLNTISSLARSGKQWRGSVIRRILNRKDLPPTFKT